MFLGGRGVSSIMMLTTISLQLDHVTAIMSLLVHPLRLREERASAGMSYRPRDAPGAPVFFSLVSIVVLSSGSPVSKVSIVVRNYILIGHWYDPVFTVKALVALVLLLVFRVVPPFPGYLFFYLLVRFSLA